MSKKSAIRNPQSAIDTVVLHADRHLNETDAVAPPIYQTTTFRSDTAAEFVERAGAPRGDRFYSRHGNPTLTQVESVIAAIEGAEAAMVTASGMAALTESLLTFAQQGTHIVCQQHHYAGTGTLLRDVLSRFGVRHTAVDQTETGAFEQAIRPETKIMIVESPSNPLMRVTDLRAVAEIARARGILTIADNTFATPVNQRPIEMGIDVVFHSGTKYFGGHADVVAGAVAGRAELVNQVWKTHLNTGAVLGPFDAWLMLRGLRTLPMRVRQHNENALKLAQFLERHPAVKIVHYPGLDSHPQHALARRQMSGFGGMMSVELKGGFSAADRLISSLRLLPRATSLGGVESLIVHPASMWVKYMTEEQLLAAGVPPGMLRISVGIEDAQDLIADFEQALAAAAGA